MTATSRAEFAFRRHDVGNFTTLDGGLDSWVDTATQRTVPTPTVSGSVAGVRRLVLSDARVSFRVEANDQTYGQMWMASGREFFIRIRPRGRGAQFPEVVYDGPMTINLIMPESGVLVFDCALRANSVSRGLQS